MLPSIQCSTRSSAAYSSSGVALAFAVQRAQPVLQPPEQRDRHHPQHAGDQQHAILRPEHHLSQQHREQPVRPDDVPAKQQ
jgi:hypothetical protein